MPDGLTWDGVPVHPGWYAVVVDYSHLPFPAARRWSGTLWDNERGIQAFDGPYPTAEDALDWAMEWCPEG